MHQTERRHRRPHPRCLPGLAAVLCLWLLSPSPGFPGGNPASPLGGTAQELININASRAQSFKGDDIAASDQFVSVGDRGLNAVYRFFIEVPPSQTNLEIDLFDADLLSNVNDRTEERDRDRATAESFVGYTLFDPDDNQVATRYVTGSDNASMAFDDAWVQFFDSETSGITGGDTFADNFGTNAYDNDDGSQNFATDWIESNDLGGAGATTGDIQVTGGELLISNDTAGSPFTNQASIEREVDLTTTAYAAANVTFDWRTTSDIEEDDHLVFEVSDDGGTTYGVLEDFTRLDGVNSGSRSYDITAFIASDTRVRFRVADKYAGANEQFLVDNFQIRANTTANGADPTAGHWLLVVDMTDTYNEGVDGNDNGDDVNAFGIRAHDGDEGSTGTEFNLYAHSFFIAGINDNADNRDYDLFPYIASGCDGDVHDFDWDTDMGNIFGSLVLTSRSTNFTHTNSTMSANNVWNSENVSGWAVADTADDYGIWQMDVNIADNTTTTTGFEGNYGPIYLGEHDAAAAPPTAQPEANTIRIYFPNDAGNAPAKPYLSQSLTYFEGSSGPNPPVQSQTSRFAVTTEITNPTGSIGDITFSASNLVTINVPGTDVLYGGVAFVTAGTVTAAPSIGGSGDVTWNPGTISPGDTEVLVFFLDVTPTAATGTLDVTGAVGSGSGTRATFIDETGDSDTGLFTFGELCELNVTVGGPPPTAVLVSSFDAAATAGGVVVEWSTAAEAATIGFELYRHEAGERVRVHRAPLTPTLAARGGTYRLLDEGAAAGGPLTYSLVEIESSGRRRSHGPFEVTPDWRKGRAAAPLAGAFESVPHATPERLQRRLAAAKLARAGRPPRGGAEAVWIGVTEPGLYRVPVSQVAPLLGLDSREARQLVESHGLRLTLAGEPVAWRPTRAGGELALELYGESVDSIYTGENVYRLEVGPGLGFTKLRGDRPPAEWSPASFRDTARGEENLRAVVLLALDPESDVWFWDFVRHGDPGAESRSFSVPVPAPAASLAAAELTLHLQGAAPGQHALEVRWNGELLGQVEVTDTEHTSPALSLAHNLITDGENVVELTAVGGDLVFVDAFELSYDRLYEADADALLSRGDGNRLVAVGGFSASQVSVLDLSDPKRPRVVTGVRVIGEGGGSYRALYEPADAATPYLAVSGAGVRQASSLTADAASDLAASYHSVDYLVLTTAELQDAAQGLADYRQSRGLDTLVVDLADVYDEFNHGLAEAPAIRDFLAHAYQSWAQAPRYVVLAGAGTYDHHDHLGLGGNLIPSLLARRDDSLFATDQLYVDLTGDDGVPEMALGRIPALTAAELDGYVAKLTDYEAQSSPPWQNRVLMGADHPEVDVDFADQSDRLAGLFPVGYEATSVHLPAFPDLPAARQAFFGAIDDGTALVNFVGHGGIAQLAQSGLLTSADVAAFEPGQMLPIVTAVTCHIGFHALPGFDSLGEELVLGDRSGSLVVWSPSWLSRHTQAQIIGDRLFRQLFQQRQPIFGEAVLEAIEGAAFVSVPRDLLLTHQLLGDPALEVRLSPPVPDPPACTENCGGEG